MRWLRNLPVMERPSARRLRIRTTVCAVSKFQTPTATSCSSAGPSSRTGLPCRGTRRRARRVCSHAVWTWSDASFRGSPSAQRGTSYKSRMNRAVGSSSELGTHHPYVVAFVDAELLPLDNAKPPSATVLPCRSLNVCATPAWSTTVMDRCPSILVTVPTVDEKGPAPDSSPPPRLGCRCFRNRKPPA